DAGDNAFEGSAHHDLGDGAPLSDAQRQSSFAITVGHQQQHFLGRSHDQRNHHHPQHDPARPHREPFHRHDYQRVHDHAPDDGRHAVENIGAEADPPVQLRTAIFGEENAAQHADRHTDAGGQAEQFESANDGVRHAATGFADWFGQLSEEIPIDRADAGFDNVVKDKG